jgi:hypothetical protein
MKKLLHIMLLIALVTTTAYAATKGPYLGVSNSSHTWNASITYSTASETKGHMEVKKNQATGVPAFGEGEKVKLLDMEFSNDSGAIISFSDYCPNIQNKYYDWLDIQIMDGVNRPQIICNASAA